MTFIELFFDLVFVFAITQLTVLLHHHLDLTHIIQGIMIFWLIWWCWQQYTWALNIANTNNVLIELFTLIATTIAFFMAIAIPEAFGDKSLLFAGTYILIRIMGLTLQHLINQRLPEGNPTANTAIISSIGLTFVLFGAILGGDLQYVFWGLAILIDLLSTTVAEDEYWVLHHEHFAERHGLIIIIALGESLIVAASGLSERNFDFDLYLVAFYAIAITGALWWSYFKIPKMKMEEGMKNINPKNIGDYARNVYVMPHFPMIAGIIGITLAIEEVIAHPDESLNISLRLILSIGLLFFVGGTVLSTWLASKIIMVPRLAFIIISVTIIYTDLLPFHSLGIGLFFLVLTFIIEHRIPETGSK